MTRAALAAALDRRVGRDALLRAIRAAARSHGVEIWLVGGYVRDVALGRTVRDLDFVAGRGSARLVRALGAAWGTRAFRFRKRGVTTWRIAAAGRLVDLVDAAHRGLARDLRRRELTVNAIAYDLDRGKLVDPLGGLADLRARRLRLAAPGAMRDDPLRALRLARFLAQLPDFRASRAARAAARAAADGLRRIAAERVRDEIDRLLLAADPRRGLAAVRDLGLLERILPELSPLAACRAGAGRPDVWRHTLDALAVAATGRASRLPGAAGAREESCRRVLGWALLLHDVAKPETLAVDPTGRPTFHGHEVLGARSAERILTRLRFSRRERRRVRDLVLTHLRPGHLADAGAPERGLRRLVRDAGDDLPLLVFHAACDAEASGAPDAPERWRRLRRVLVRLLALHAERGAAPPPRLVGGRDLMAALDLAPGPRLGQLLRHLREQQELGLVLSRAEALAAAARWLAGR